MSLTKDGFYKQIGGEIGDNSYLLQAGGGAIAYGNASGNIPISNGTVNTDLNADMVDGYHIGDLDSRYVNVTGDTMTGTLGKSNNYLIKPVADYRTNGNVHTGCIAITLPANINNTMVSMWIDVYNWSTNTSFSVHCGGYTYKNSTWVKSPFALVLGANHRVRFGHNETNFVIYIGETNSSWSYPQVTVRDVILGYNPTYANWYKNWTISFVTSVSNVTADITRYDITSSNIGSQSVSYATYSTYNTYQSIYENNTNNNCYISFVNNTSYSLSYIDSSLYYNPYLNALGHGINVIATGEGSHAEGSNTTASGNYSHAEGFVTTASGDYSHAKGYYTTASGFNSHAEGYYTTASGSGSHAEGLSTTASGSHSHAEGASTNAIGTCSHAEGGSTTASADYSHAEGYNTTAYDSSSHAEGSSTIAYDYASHAEGYNTTAYGSSSHAEGYGTTSYTFSHAEGYYTYAYGWASHAEGCMTTTTGEYSHAEGYGTIVYSYSHAEGNSTTASGTNSHAEGYYTTASGFSSHAEGYYTTASGVSSHAEGYYTTASGFNSHAEGYYTTASGLYSHAGGNTSIANGQYSFAFGNNIKTSNENEVSFGKYNVSNSDTAFSIGGGTSTTRSNLFEVTTSGLIKCFGGTMAGALTVEGKLNIGGEVSLYNGSSFRAQDSVVHLGETRIYGTARLNDELYVNSSAHFNNIDTRDICPKDNNYFDLGSPNKYWKEIFVGTGDSSGTGGGNGGGHIWYGKNWGPNKNYNFGINGLIIYQDYDETSGIQFNGDYINMWSPCDDDYSLRYWDANSGNEAWYIDNNGHFSGSASKLTNARTLWGQSFNGTANVSGNMSSVGNITSTTNNTYSIGTSSNKWKGIYATKFYGALSGNASTASKWYTARTITIGNTGKSVDGSANVSWTLAEIGAATAGHNHDDRYVRAYGTTNDNIDSDWGQSIKTFDPIPSGTPPEQNPNITLLSLGNNFARRKMFAFTYNNDNIYYRRHSDSTFSTWVQLIHSGNIGSQTVALANGLSGGIDINGINGTNNDLNSNLLNANRIYYHTDQASNTPVSGIFGTVLQISNQDSPVAMEYDNWITQLDFVHNGDLYYRSNINENRWTEPWKKVLTNYDLPVGTILMWCSSTIPSSYLLCNGQSFNATTYPELYNILGTNTVPDLKDRFIVGAGNSYSLKSTGGEATHTLTIAEMPSHNHTYQKGIKGRGYDAVDDDYPLSIWEDALTTSTGGGQAHNNMPPYYALYFIIKAR